MSEALDKVDSAVAGLGTSPEEKKGRGERKERKSSSNTGVYNINDLGTFNGMVVMMRGG
jgi:hypothetical protein